MLNPTMRQLSLMKNPSGKQNLLITNVIWIMNPELKTLVQKEIELITEGTDSKPIFYTM